MAISNPTVLAQVGQTTTAAAITSASVSPSANALLVVAAGCPFTATALPVTFSDTLSGGSLTWTVYSFNIGGGNSANIAFGVAVCGATPGSGTITATWNSASVTRRSLIVCQVASGFNTVTPVAQSKTGGQTGASTLSITLDATPNVGSLVMAAVEHRQAGVADAAAGTNFTELVEQNSGTGSAVEVQYDNASATTTVDWSSLSTIAAAGVAIEIAPTPPATKAFIFPTRPLRIWRKRR